MNFKFADQVRGESGVHGNSGVHDVDYPVLDKAVGRSAEKKWERINREKETRAKIRKESGTNALTKSGGKIAPVSADVLQIREQAISKLNEVKKG